MNMEKETWNVLMILVRFFSSSRNDKPGKCVQKLCDQADKALEVIRPILSSVFYYQLAL